MKRQKVDKAAPAGYAAQMMKPAQATLEPAACVLPWPWPLEDFAAQPSSLQDYALSPLETEVLWLRAGLAQSTEREESLTTMLKACRIQLHKAYRMIALHHINNFVCDTEMPTFPDVQNTTLPTEH